MRIAGVLFMMARRVMRGFMLRAGFGGRLCDLGRGFHAPSFCHLAIGGSIAIALVY
jgi:hypothetical protein